MRDCLCKGGTTWSSDGPGRATLPGANPIGYEIFHTLLYGRNTAKREECVFKGVWPDIAQLIGLKTRDSSGQCIYGKGMKRKTIKLYFSQIWLNLEGSCFLSLKENFFQLRWMLSLITESPGKLSISCPGFQKVREFVLGEVGSGWVWDKWLKCLLYCWARDFKLQSIYACCFVCVCVCVYLTPRIEITKKPQLAGVMILLQTHWHTVDCRHMVIFFKHIFQV